ncbi:class I SAM-dependent methyltransferase [Amycolatopsis cihanbeyliensis]|uniref:Methyltransferase family protein n=1 Tax=Amycolatopsis cihanbeyliensis TaxID=1128664 RepID=A0A542DLR3_AMYCI|nr:class I SAM-dependent methyltransferase [Amycolatopsis cihanbeyliensis]TQJ04030.1 methyltransferase family protein [Amycolatopsis cihanbeyliensis]
MNSSGHTTQASPPGADLPPLEGYLDTLVDRVMARVDRTIVDGDPMFDGSVEQYFRACADALRAVLGALLSTGNGAPRRVLDFGCGHGRVLRGLRAAFPAAELLACDTDEDAVARCGTAFGATPIAGELDVIDIQQVHGVDLIWCGSVLTHFDPAQWDLFLRYFARALNPGGVVVTTIHGRRVAWRARQGAEYGLGARATDRLLATYHACGQAYEGQGEGWYGISLCSPGSTVDRAARAPGLRLACYQEAAWDRHQDVLVLVKDAETTLWTAP